MEGKKENCFVLMPFGHHFDRYFQNIYVPAIEDSGLAAVRADSLFRSSSILHDIWNHIKQARVLLADLTDTNSSVFYELGLAHAIGEPVVLVSNDIEDVPFDLRGLRVLIYDKDREDWGADLRSRITKALHQTLTDIASAVPPPFAKASAPAALPNEDPLIAQLRAVEFQVRALRTEREQLRLRDETAKALRTLTPMEEKVVRMRFGLDDGTEQSLNEIAEGFAVTRERVRQIEAKALRKLRHPRREEAPTTQPSGSKDDPVK